MEKTNCLDVSSELLLSAFCLAAVDLIKDKMMNDDDADKNVHMI